MFREMLSTLVLYVVRVEGPFDVVPHSNTMSPLGTAVDK
jgi:hypothetical protein